MKECLNCGSKVESKFCSNCGQKTDVTRLSIKHFFTHHILHGVLHVDRGILFTIKQAFVRPGKAALDYIAGKRIRYYNVFYLILITLTLNIIILHYLEGLRGYRAVQSEGDGVKLDEFLSKYVKYIILCFVPLFSLNARLLFNRVAFNLAEHHILAGIALFCATFIVTVSNLLELIVTLLFREVSNGSRGASPNWVSLAIICLIFFYTVLVYVQALYKHYTTLGFIWRMASVYVLFLIELIALLVLVIQIISGGNFEGTYQI